MQEQEIVKKGEFKESEHDRFVRYEDAKADALLWQSRLDEVYKYVAPNRVRYTQQKAQSTTNEVFDATAMLAVKQYANNIQSTLMPPFKRWYELQAGYTLKDNFSEQSIETINEQLQTVTDITFRYINNSNFYNVASESFEDAAVSTGIVLLNEGSQEDPLQFSSVAMSNISIEEGNNGNLENFWIKLTLRARHVLERWPDAKVSDNMSSIIKNKPSEMVELIQGCIHYQNNDAEHQYYYYIQDPATQKDIYFEWYEYNPFTGFRIHKAPGETYGRGIADLIFPFIKVLNKMSEFTLKAAKFHAFPAYLASRSGSLNPHTIIIEPGAIIPVARGFSKDPPIVPLQAGGDPKFTEMSIAELRQTVKDAFLVDQLGNIEEVKNRSATEMQIRNNNMLRQNAVAFGRLEHEFVRPILQKVVLILRKKGILKDIVTEHGALKISIDNKNVLINYKSPLIAVQDEEDAMNLEKWVSSLIQLVGPTGLIAVELSKLPHWLAKKMGVDLKMVKSEDETKKRMEALQQQAQQQQVGEEKMKAEAQQKPQQQQQQQQQAQQPDMGSY